MLLLAASLLFTEPVPLDMPRAEGYRVREGSRYRQEDRFVRSDLWLTQAVDGRWTDDEGRVFVLATLSVEPPAGPAAESTVTRLEYERTRRDFDPRDLKMRREILAFFLSFDPPEKPSKPESMPRGFRDVEYWHGTNESVVVCAYRLKRSDVWRLAFWNLVEDDDFAESLETFERDVLSAEVQREPPFSLPSVDSVPKVDERALFIRDASHAVAAYPTWHVTDTPEIVILDDLAARDVISSITNLLPDLHARFAAVLPAGFDASGNACVARLFASRDEYLDALEADGRLDLVWSAAYWSPVCRELVAYGGTELTTFLRTFRHESFHQYLSYATTMLSVSPWLNEGYAQYFETDEPEDDFTDWTPETLESLAQALPSLLEADYESFYAGSDAERQLKYRLALSLVIFLEKGAPNVRFRPFRFFKRDYFRTLFETKNMVMATHFAFGGEARRKLFIAEWQKYWENR